MSGLPPVIEWTLYIVIATAIVALAVGTFVTAGTWLAPRLDMMSKGRKRIRGHLPCCPPGMGCNDPDETYRKCLRVEARRLGSVEDVIALDGLWARAHGAKAAAKKRKLLGEYGAKRDAIIAARMREAADQIEMNRAAQLPRHVGEQPEVVSGVVENGARTGKSTSSYGSY